MGRARPRSAWGLGRQPFQDVRAGGLQRPGEAVRHAPVVAPPRRRRGATRGASARSAALWGARGWRLSRCFSQRSSCRAASVGAAVAWLGGQAARAGARVPGWTGHRTRKAYGRQAETSGPWLRARPTATGRPVPRSWRARAPASLASGWWSRGRHAPGAESAACPQTSCWASAQAMPTKAANASCGRRCRCYLLRCARGVAGPCVWAFGAGMLGSRWRGSPCVGVTERTRTRGSEGMGTSLRCFGLDTRTLRGHVPALTESDLPAVGISRKAGQSTYNWPCSRLPPASAALPLPGAADTWRSAATEDGERGSAPVCLQEGSAEPAKFEAEQPTK